MFASKLSYRCPSAHGIAQFAARYHSLVETPEHHLTHIDKQGRPAMVDISNKEITNRSATGEGRIFIPKVAYELIQNTQGSPRKTSDRSELSCLQTKARAKGDVLTVAQLAGIMASKKTSDLIPLCHPIPLSHVSIDLSVEDYSGLDKKVANNRRYSIHCRATATCEGKTGVEMEALTAISVSLLTVWDMLKAVAGKDMLIEGICVTSKSGGRSGHFVRSADEVVRS